MHTYLSIPGFIVGIATVLGLARRYVVRPIRAGIRRLEQLVAQLGATNKIGQELAELAGSIVKAFDDVGTELKEHKAQLTAQATELLDQGADINRLKRKVREHSHAA